MVEKFENQVCGACGVDVRPNALFCYNCGSQVASDEMVAAENKRSKKVRVPKAAVTNKLGKLAEVKPIAADKFTETTIEKPVNLRTAASLRDKSRLAQKKRVEVVWEEPTSAPNVWFLIVTLILALFAACILYIMLYLR